MVEQDYNPQKPSLAADGSACTGTSHTYVVFAVMESPYGHADTLVFLLTCFDRAIR